MALSLKNVSFAKILTILVLWFLVWAALQCLVLYFSVGLPAGIAIRDSVLTHGVFAAGAFALGNGMQFYQPGQIMRVVSSLLMAIACTWIVQLLGPSLVSSDPDYKSFLEQTFLIRSIFGWLLVGVVSTSAWLLTTFREQQQLEQRKLATEQLARDAELSRLRQQLQPHFLFNSLNSISALVLANPEEARRMIQQLSDFLRGTLKKDDQQLVTFAEELEHLQLYLDIEKVRFGNRLHTDIQTDEHAASLTLPSLLLQPIVENAIKFGLYDTIGKITIRLNAAKRDNVLEVRIDNPFDPETASPRQGTGFGLSSVQRRLFLLYSRSDLLETSANGTIFTTTLRIPQ